MGKFRTSKYGAIHILKPSNGSWPNPDWVKISELLRVIATIAAPMVPIRDINRGWIQAVEEFSHFGRVNRVNAIVVYDFFCVSSACRDSDRERQRLNADSSGRFLSGREMILCRYGWL